MVDTADPLAATASSDADYQRLGLTRNDIKPWEDGARTDDRPGTYEWWYFDAHLEDGAKLVVVFMDKDLATPQKPLEPTIRLNLDLADGRSFERFVTFDPATWSSAKDHADVRIGENRFTGDLEPVEPAPTLARCLPCRSCRLPRSRSRRSPRLSPIRPTRSDGPSSWGRSRASSLHSRRTSVPTPRS